MLKSRTNNSAIHLWEGDSIAINKASYAPACKIAYVLFHSIIFVFHHHTLPGSERVCTLVPMDLFPYPGFDWNAHQPVLAKLAAALKVVLKAGTNWYNVQIGLWVSIYRNTWSIGSIGIGLKHKYFKVLLPWTQKIPIYPILLELLPFKAINIAINRKSPIFLPIYRYYQIYFSNHCSSPAIRKIHSWKRKIRDI